MRKIAHPIANIITRQVFARAEEISTVLAELRVAESQELIVTIADPNTVVEGPVDAGVYFIVSLLVCRGVYSTLEL